MTTSSRRFEFEIVCMWRSSELKERKKKIIRRRFERCRKISWLKHTFTFHFHSPRPHSTDDDSRRFFHVARRVGKNMVDEVKKKESKSKKNKQQSRESEVNNVKNSRCCFWVVLFSLNDDSDDFQLSLSSPSRQHRLKEEFFFLPFQTHSRAMSS